MKNQFSIIKNIPLFLALMFFVSGHLCNNNETPKIQFQDLSIVKTNSYEFYIRFQSAQTFRNQNAENGTNFKGNFALVTLKNRQNQSFQYQSTELSFQCPAIHRPKKINQQIIQLQIILKASKSKIVENLKLQYPFKTVILSYPFMISQFVPAKNKQLTSYLNSSFQNGMIINLQNLLSTNPQMPVVVYKGSNHRFPNEEVLYMVRKQLRLLSKSDSKEIQTLIQPYLHLQKAEPNKIQAKNIAPSKLYQIKAFKLQKKQEL